MYFVRVSDVLVEWKSEYEGESTWSKTVNHDQSDIWSTPIKLVDAREKKPVCFMRKATDIFPVSILKSNVQKTFRRNCVKECLSSTQQLLRQDTTEALRRLPIIFLEDGMLHKDSFNLVVWLMVAHSKGYMLTQRDEELVLCSVTTALSSPHRYSLYMDSSNSNNKTIPMDGYSMVLRSVYGGMKGDMDMLMRLAKRSEQLETVDVWVIVPPFPSFSIEQMIPESIDFHCCGSLISWCTEKTNLNQNDIKSAIWWHWSSSNIREIVEDKTAVDYEEKERRNSQATYTRIKALLYTYSSTKLKWMITQKKKVMIQTTLKF